METPTLPIPPSPKPPIVPIFILLILAVAIASFLLGKYSTKPATSPPIAQISPIPTGPIPTPTIDLTADWKIYNYDKCGDYPGKLPFSFKIPSFWIESVTQEASCCTRYGYSTNNLKFTITCGDGFGGGGCGQVNELIQNKFISNGKTISGCLEKIKETNTLILELTYLHPKEDEEHKPGISFSAKGQDTPVNRQLINQILSTFRFLD